MCERSEVKLTIEGHFVVVLGSDQWFLYRQSWKEKEFRKGLYKFKQIRERSLARGDRSCICICYCVNLW